MKYRPLSPAAVAEALKGLPGWEFKESWLRKTFKFESFREAIQFVNRVADVAEQVVHHPDIYVRQENVVLILQTHQAHHQVTEFDIDLARRIDAMQSARGMDAL